MQYSVHCSVRNVHPTVNSSAIYTVYFMGISISCSALPKSILPDATEVVPIESQDFDKQHITGLRGTHRRIHGDLGSERTRCVPSFAKRYPIVIPSINIVVFAGNDASSVVVSSNCLSGDIHSDAAIQHHPSFRGYISETA